MTTPAGEITELLAEMAAAPPGAASSAASRLVPLVYPELRRLADRYMRRETPGHTLQSTALVHEAYIRLLGQREQNFQNRAHFYGVAAHLMRLILVDHARNKIRDQRHAEAYFTLAGEAGVTNAPAAFLLQLHEALDRLAERGPRQCQIVEMRYFGGLTEAEIAVALGISERTVKRDWSIARAYLFHRMSR